jgi:hypothetical protein
MDGARRGLLGPLARGQPLRLRSGQAWAAVRTWAVKKSRVWIVRGCGPDRSLSESEDGLGAHREGSRKSRQRFLPVRRSRQ